MITYSHQNISDDLRSSQFTLAKVALLFRYLYLRNDTPQNKKKWNMALHNYILKGQLPPVHSCVLQQVSTMDCSKVSDQISLLSSIPIFPRWQYITCDGEKSSNNICVKLTEHLLYHPSCEESDTFKLKYIPKSPRNRLMNYIFSDTQYLHSIQTLIDQLLKLDRNDDTPLPNPQHNNLEFSDECPPKKRRKYSTRVLKVTHEMLCDNMCVSLSKPPNSIDTNTSLYHKFKEQLVVEGTIQWRQHNDLQDTVIMSDYSPDTQSLKQLAYAHVK